MARNKKLSNLVGPQIRARRYVLGLTQDQLAAKCQLHGLDISRATLSQIEAQLRCVKDWELFELATVVGVSIDKLFVSGKRKVITKAK